MRLSKSAWENIQKAHNTMEQDKKIRSYAQLIDINKFYRICKKIKRGKHNRESDFVCFSVIYTLRTSETAKFKMHRNNAALVHWCAKTLPRLPSGMENAECFWKPRLKKYSKFVICARLRAEKENMRSFWKQQQASKAPVSL